jgi:hypothetical protein
MVGEARTTGVTKGNERNKEKRFDLLITATYGKNTFKVAVELITTAALSVDSITTKKIWLEKQRDKVSENKSAMIIMHTGKNVMLQMIILRMWIIALLDEYTKLGTWTLLIFNAPSVNTYSNNMYSGAINMNATTMPKDEEHEYR